MKNNKINLVLHFSVIIFTLYILYMRFIRFLLADNETIAMAMLNPGQLPTAQPILFSGLMLVLVLMFLGLLRLKPSSGFVFRLMKGLFGYCIILLILQFLIVVGEKKLPADWTKSVFESKHLFVEIQSNQSRLRAGPSLDSKVITTVDSGTLLLLNDVKKSEGLTWNRVFLASKTYAWVVRVAPSKNGEVKRLSKTNKFYFTVLDQYSFIIALFGFLWGFLSYRKR